MEHRTRKMTFRLTEDEYNTIKDKVSEAGISQQKFLLQTALEKEIIHIKEYQDLIFQIKKIGTNINQITRHCNEAKYISNSEVAEVKRGLEDIWQLLNQSKIHIPV